MENPKQLFHSAEERIKKIIKGLGNFLTFALVLAIGFAIGYYYYVFTTKPTNESPLGSVKTMNETSVAVNERNELLIIDRTTGHYTVYCDSVGSAIFTVYANQKYQAAVKP